MSQTTREDDQQHNHHLNGDDSTLSGRAHNSPQQHLPHAKHARPSDTYRPLTIKPNNKRDTKSMDTRGRRAGATQPNATTTRRVSVTQPNAMRRWVGGCYPTL